MIVNLPPARGADPDRFRKGETDYQHEWRQSPVDLGTDSLGKRARSKTFENRKATLVATEFEHGVRLEAWSKKAPGFHGSGGGGIYTAVIPRCQLDHNTTTDKHDRQCLGGNAAALEKFIKKILRTYR